MGVQGPDAEEISTKKIVVAWSLLLALMVFPFLFKAAFAAFPTNRVKMGEYATCGDIWGDRFHIAVEGVSYDQGILTLTLSVNYELVNRDDEKDRGQAAAAVEVFLLDAAYVQNGFQSVNCLDGPKGITSYIAADAESARVIMNFQAERRENSVLAVRTYKGIDGLSEEQLREG